MDNIYFLTKLIYVWKGIHERFGCEWDAGLVMN